MFSNTPLAHGFLVELITNLKLRGIPGVFILLGSSILRCKSYNNGKADPISCLTSGFSLVTVATATINDKIRDGRSVIFL